MVEFYGKKASFIPDFPVWEQVPRAYGVYACY